jgi:hypothetical protein
VVTLLSVIYAGDKTVDIVSLSNAIAMQWQFDMIGFFFAIEIPL